MALRYISAGLKFYINQFSGFYHRQDADHFSRPLNEKQVSCKIFHFEILCLQKFSRPLQF